MHDETTTTPTIARTAEAIVERIGRGPNGPVWRYWLTIDGVLPTVTGEGNVLQCEDAILARTREAGLQRIPPVAAAGWEKTPGVAGIGDRWSWSGTLDSTAE